ncbi:MAG: sugar phosphate isomerase/epimerase [bacterium]|nr:sugar phosphate isomerase/epimerase [bacterium]
MLNRLGAATIVDSPVNIEDYIDFIKSLGMGYIEIRTEKNLASPQDLTDSDIKRIREKILSCRLIPIVHASFYDINIASLNILPRKASIEQIKICIEFAAKIGSSLVVTHAGSISKDYSQKYVEIGHNNTINSLKEIVAFAEKKDIIVGLENKQHSNDNYEMVEHFKEHLDFIKIINSPNLKVIFDVGHANINNMIEVDMREYIYKLKDYLVEMHVHDNLGTIDEHLALGKGNVKYLEAIKTVEELGLKIPVVLELKSMEDIKKSVQNLLSSECFKK